MHVASVAGVFLRVRLGQSFKRVGHPHDTRRVSKSVESCAHKDGTTTPPCASLDEVAWDTIPKHVCNTSLDVIDPFEAHHGLGIRRPLRDLLAFLPVHVGAT